jgi:hypothetical protein
MRTREILREAKRLGHVAGEAAASWATDGNTTRETAARIIKGFDEGDPAVLDMFRIPNLSGEWADGPTPASLCEDVGFDAEAEPERAEYLEGDICDAWEEAVSLAFWDTLIRDCKRILA